MRPMGVQGCSYVEDCCSKRSARNVCGHSREARRVLEY